MIAAVARPNSGASAATVRIAPIPTIVNGKLLVMLDTITRTNRGTSAGLPFGAIPVYI